MANRQQGSGDQQRTQGQGKQAQSIQNQSMQGQGMQQGQDRFDTTYWQQQYRNEPYYNQARNFGDYEPAYRLGSESRGRYAGQRFEDVEGDLRGEYEASRGDSQLGWDEAREATRAAWDREERMDTRGRDRQGQDR
jgi:hypothetical protein